jgi:hypothetical protein
MANPNRGGGADGGGGGADGGGGGVDGGGGGVDGGGGGVDGGGGGADGGGGGVDGGGGGVEFMVLDRFNSGFLGTNGMNGTRPGRVVKVKSKIANLQMAVRHGFEP